MAGASTTVSTIISQVSSPPQIQCFKISWLADDSDGSVLPASLPNFDGKILLVVVDPGSPAPTANYNITLKDGTGLDVMHGALQNRSDTVTEYARCSVVEPMDRPVAGAVGFALTGNSVNSAVGAVYVYVELLTA